MIFLNSIQEVVKNQQDFFSAGLTVDYPFRKKQLEKLLEAITKHEKEILEALKKDLNKSEFEGYITEVGLVRQEIRHTLKSLKKWMKPKREKTPLAHFISSSKSYRDPYGTVLIMAPWNYPFQLVMLPLIGALAAGNCVILKPSDYSSFTTQVIEKIIREIYEENYVYVATGGREKNKELLNQKFDYLFFTGGATVGKLVMESAAKNLTPLTLELGGKSPCIVDASANLRLSAKRIIWGKLVNAGQTCVAPDYLLVDECIKDELIREMQKWIQTFFGNHPEKNSEYPAIINQKHLDRLKGLVENHPHKVGGAICEETRQMAPTLIWDVDVESDLMKEEIFGPILPIITYQKWEEVKPFIAAREKPLALYLFTTSKDHEEEVLKSISFGGGCINDVIIHVSNAYLPFGGVGASGMGSYHGKKSFDTFSHQKGIMKKFNILDIPLRYAPYKDHLKWIKKIMK